MKGNIVKKIISPLSRIYRHRIANKRAFRCARCMLKKGIYYKPIGINEFRLIDKAFFSIQNLSQLCIYCNLKQRKQIQFIGGEDNTVDSICFGLGKGKVVLMTNEKAYGFYDTEDLYLQAKNNYLKNYNSFNYPCARIYGYEDNINLIVMERVRGEIIRDYVHDNIVITELLKKCISSETIITKDNEVLFLQHGDAKPDNIIWVNEKYYFIDLDSIQFLPPLFDVFHYLAVYKLEDVITILENNIELIKEICKRADIDLQSNIFDNLFYRYITQYKNWGCCYSDFNNLNTEYTYRNYPLTANLLKSIYG